MHPPTRALVRRPPRSYRAYYAANDVAIDLPLADRQHAAYVGALASAGLAISEIAPDEAQPDGVFIEDTAVVCADRVLVTRMVDRREGEQVAVATSLGATHEIMRLPPDARLEGGDVLHTGDTTYVGLSARTNRRGADALREFLAPSGRRVVEVPVDRCLHLKSAATYLGNGHLLVARDWIDPAVFDVEAVVETATGEAKAANAIRAGNHLLSLAGYPATTRRIAAFADARALTVHTLDMSEFEKGDGSLTCLSILLSR